MVRLLAFCLLGACTASSGVDVEGDEAAVYVGTLRGGEVFAASIWDGNEALLYTCGYDRLNGTTLWLRGTAMDGVMDTTQDAFSVAASQTEAQVTGTLRTPDGEEELVLSRAAKEDAGLFLHTEGGCVTAAVAQRRDGELALQGAHFCAPEGPFFQVTPVLPPEVLGDRLVVRIEGQMGELELTRVESLQSS